MTSSNNFERCPVCGTPSSDWLDENCPICLMELGTTPAQGKASPIESLAPGQTGPAAIRHVGDYELLEEIARGGMGVVYRARQVTLDRTVAVKVLLAGHFANDTFIKRFRREAEAAASLSHPNIVAIHEVGEHQGQPYFSMELIEGRSLADLAREKPLAAREAAQLLKTIAETVHFAHQSGLLHRDLKPSNVLVDALNVPHITDFGLVKRVEDADLTLTGQVLGTPNYMPPEQADPKRGPTTVTSDVYSLGAILYQLLTGRAPFMAETVTQTLRLVTDTEAVSPRILNPGMPRDLETICARCLEKDPQRRYASAQELAEELDRFLKDEPIWARPISAPAKLMRWCRRKPALASAVGAGFVLLLVIAIGSPIAIIRINGAREAAEAARELAEAARKQEAGLRARAESAERETEQQLYTALAEQARAIVRSGEMGQRVQALDAIRRAAAISNSAELRREVFAALALPDLRFERELPYGQEFTIRDLHPSFERIALCRGRGPVEIRSVSDDRLLATLPASTNLPAYSCWWSADGRYLAVKRDRSGDGWRTDWEIWDLTTSRRVLLFQDLPRNSVSFHPRLRRILVGGRTGDLSVWNLEDGRELVRLPRLGVTAQLEFAPEGDRFAAARALPPRSWVISVYNATNGLLLASNVFPDAIPMFQWHPSGRWLAAADKGGAVHWMDAHTGESRVLGRHKSEARRAEFSPDGAYLISGAWGREMICWDAGTLQRAFRIALNGYVPSFSTDSRALALETPTSLQLYSFEQPSGYREFPEDLGTGLRHAAFSTDGRWLAASADHQMAVWDLTVSGPGALDENARDAHCFFTSGGRELFGLRHRPNGDNVGFRWRVTPATEGDGPPRLEPLPLHKPRGFTSLCLISNSVVMNSTNGSQILAPAEIEAGSERWAATIAGHSDVSPDGRWLGIFRSYGASLYVYRLPGFEQVAKLARPTYFRDFHFSPLGDEVSIISTRTGVEFWSTTTWQRTRALTNFHDPFLYTPDARSLWLTKDRTAGLYDARTLEPLLLLPTGMLPLVVSPDGQRVAVSVDAQRLQVWDLAALRKQFRELGLDWGETDPK